MNEKGSPALEERVAKVEGILEEVRARLNHIETRLIHIDSQIGQLWQEIAQLRRDMHSQFRWTIGIMLGILIPMWVTIILAIIFTP